jgi:hypothetical protein
LHAATPLTLVSLLLAPLCKCHVNAIRKRLKTWYAPKNTLKRRLTVHPCFAGLLRWITTDWSRPTVLLAMDTTTIRNRWIILTIRVLYKKRAIPVAWRVLPWHKQKWNPIWKQLLRALAPAFPSGVQVLVLANRGLYAPELFAYIRQVGAHPLMQMGGDGKVLIDGSSEWQALRNLSPCEASAVWYRHRSWIEQGFRDLKRLRWSCHRTLVRGAGRLERVWLALSVVTLEVLWYGTGEGAAGRVWGRRRVVSVFRLGWLLVWLEVLECVEGLRCGWFPEIRELWSCDW